MCLISWLPSCKLNRDLILNTTTVKGQVPQLWSSKSNNIHNVVLFSCKKTTGDMSSWHFTLFCSIELNYQPAVHKKKTKMNERFTIVAFRPLKGAFSHRQLCHATRQTSDSSWHHSVAFGALELKVCTLAEERRASPSLSLPLKSRCSVAGKAALSASTLRYVTGGSTHPRTLSVSFFLKRTPPPTLPTFTKQ